MAQHDMNIANQGFPAFRSDLNDALAALVSNSSGATEPSTTFAHQMWVDTAADPSILKIRNADNDAWITIGQIDQTGDKFNLICANATISENLTLNAQGDLRFADSDSSNWVAFQAPATVASNVTWTLPSADGTANQALVTDGSGTLSWASAGGNQILDGNSDVTVTDSGTGKIEFTVDAVEVADFTTSAVVFNETGANQDFRVEGDTDANLFFVDASTDRVGIGTASPADELHINSVGSNVNLRLTRDTDTGARISGSDGTSPAVIFETIATGTATERMRIDSSGNLNFNSGYGSVATAYGCRAWVNFNGTGTVAIREDGNVSSITDNGTGDYTVNFTTAMSDANYSSSGMNGANTSGSRVIHEYSRTDSALRVLCTNGATAVGDYTYVSVAIHR